MEQENNKSGLTTILAIVVGVLALVLMVLNLLLFRGFRSLPTDRPTDSIWLVDSVSTIR